MGQTAETHCHRALLQFRGALIELVETRALEPRFTGHRTLPGADILLDRGKEADFFSTGSKKALEILLPRHTAR